MHFTFVGTRCKSTSFQAIWVGMEAAGTYTDIKSLESGRRREAQSELHRNSSLPRAKILIFFCIKVGVYVTVCHLKCVCVYVHIYNILILDTY